MRTTLTIDDEGAAELDRVRRRARDAKLRDLVNEALRLGLRQLEAVPAPAPAGRKPFRTRSVHLGGLLIDSVDNIAEVLAIAEGEDFR